MLRTLVVLAVLLGAVPTARADVEASVTFETFDSPLAAQGEWVMAGSYGRVWRPHGLYAGWRPYLDGRWEWTEEGWLWVSDEPWSWATYHYGRWSWEPAWGWIWVPGYEWAPAWVEWRYSAGCVGWAPLFPLGLYPRPIVYEHWTFVPSHSFVGVHARTVAWSPDRVREHWHTTAPAPGWHEGRGHAGRDAYGSPMVHRAEPAFGPPRTFVEHETGRPLQVVRPVNVSNPGELGRRHDAPEIFRPVPGERRSSSAPATPSAPAVRATPPERREVRPEARSVTARPETRPVVNRPGAQPTPSRLEPVRPSPMPMVDRAEPFRPASSPREISRPAPQRFTPAPQVQTQRSAPPAMHPSYSGGSSAPRPVVQQAQPARRTGGQEARHHR